MSNNAENLPITNERGDDIPLLIAQLKEMRVPELLNQSFPTHGNWQGLSPGHLVTLWLTFILSESNHRISHLRSWAADRLQTLADCLGLPLVESDFTDDRLTQALDYLSDQEGWRIFEDLILLEVNIDLRRVEQEVRAYGDRQASVRVKEELSVSVRMKAEAVAEAKQALGWRGDATGAKSEKLSLTKAVLAYRGSYVIERGFPRLKGHPLSLTPIYLTTSGSADWTCEGGG